MRCSNSPQQGAWFHDRVRVVAKDRLPGSPSAPSKIFRASRVGARMGEAQELHCGGPAIVFGGPYGNLEATRALLDEAARLGISPGRILWHGAGSHVVMGNCEERLASAADDCGCGYAPGSACDRLAAAWFAHADRELGAAARLWMAQLPRRIDLMIAGARLAVVHGGIERINRFIFASTAATIKAQELARK